jgi:hypothetical protein
MWWREPGVFSGPLLANQSFRSVFLKRLREVCTNVFTEARIFPLIDAMEERLEGEIAFRAGGRSPERAMSEFRGHMQSFRNQVTNRRKFILAELDKETSASR